MKSPIFKNYSQWMNISWIVFSLKALSKFLNPFRYFINVIMFGAEQDVWNMINFEVNSDTRSRRVSRISPWEGQWFSRPHCERIGQQRLLFWVSRHIHSLPRVSCSYQNFFCSCLLYIRYIPQNFERVSLCNDDAFKIILV